MMKAGTRGSKLARAQAREALDYLARHVPGFAARPVYFKTPGDRDRQTPIEKGAPDFFTRDLDEAVRSGKVDFAIHSAKDLPEKMAADLDWLWLPIRGAREDVLVIRKEDNLGAGSLIGVSSARRKAYAQHRYPRAKCVSIRGAIDDRIAQLRAGKVDAVIMAKAGLDRLYGGKVPAGVEYRQVIPTYLLETPEAQGRLAIVFRPGDARFDAVRDASVKAVRFVSAGTGSAELITVQGRSDLYWADTIIYDSLLGRELFDDELLQGKRKIFVGKRAGRHAMTQDEISALIANEARTGRRVVRLKGGDAGIFGRLSEEIDALAAAGIPFVVRPGVSALTAGTTGTGLLLTARGATRGFQVYTPRSTATEENVVVFMAAKQLAQEARKMMAAGRAGATPCAVVYDAAGLHEEVVKGTLAAFAAHAPEPQFADAPGLFVVGPAAGLAYPGLGRLKGQRILMTCSADIADRTFRTLEDWGGRPIRWPLIRLVPALENSTRKREYNVVILTSPTAARIFERNAFDFKFDSLHTQVWTTGKGTAAALNDSRWWQILKPSGEASAEGLLADLRTNGLPPLPRLAHEQKYRILRLRSDKAGAGLAREIRTLVPKDEGTVDDVVLYRTETIRYEECFPACDAIFFASTSAVTAFVENLGKKGARAYAADKKLYAIGRPTQEAVRKAFSRQAEILPTYEGEG